MRRFGAQPRFHPSVPLLECLFHLLLQLRCGRGGLPVLYLFFQELLLRFGAQPRFHPSALLQGPGLLEPLPGRYYQAPMRRLGAHPRFHPSALLQGPGLLEPLPGRYYQAPMRRLGAHPRLYPSALLQGPGLLEPLPGRYYQAPMRRLGAQPRFHPSTPLLECLFHLLLQLRCGRWRMSLQGQGLRIPLMGPACRVLPLHFGAT